MAKSQTSKRAGKSARSRAGKAPKKIAKATARKATRSAQKMSKRVVSQSGAARTPKKKAGAAAKRASKRIGTAKPSAADKTTSRPTSKDALAVLKDDHRTVEQLFKRFEKAGDDAAKTKGRLVGSMIENLSIHAEIEEMVFYPAVRQEMNRVASDVLEALEEHHLVKVVLRELEGMAPTDERFDAKVTVMIENVRHHVKEEEAKLFPRVREQFTTSRLVDLGKELRQAKRGAPTRPHPAAPDTPPSNALIGSATAVLDRAVTAGKNAIDRVREDVPLL